jgi:hypothetical protein
MKPQSTSIIVIVRREIVLAFRDIAAGSRRTAAAVPNR